MDLTRLLPGPLAGKLLWEMGFPVLKVEPPGGDPLEALAPEAYRFLNGGKEVLRLDLKRPEEREVFLGLVRESAVLLESNRPGVMERLGLALGSSSRPTPAWSTSASGATGTPPTPGTTSLIWQRRGFLAAFPGNLSSSPTWQGPMPWPSPPSRGSFWGVGSTRWPWPRR